MGRQRWYDELSHDERAEWHALQLEAAQKKLERYGGEVPERIHMAIAARATEERRRAGRVPRRALWVSTAALAVSLTVGGFTLWHWWASERPQLVVTDGRLYINHQANPPPEWVRITWGNTGKTAASRGTATLFTISEDGKRHEKFGTSEITAGNNSSTTLVPTFGYGSAFVSIDMQMFLGLFLVCIKYHDGNLSYRQHFVFRQGSPLTEQFLTRLDELSSTHFVCPA
jgi:hypothetical protein